MNKFIFIFHIYFMLLAVAFILPSLSFGIIMTILIAYILIPKRYKPKWLNLQSFGIVLAATYIFLSSEPFSHFGMSLGRWDEYLLEYIFISIIVLTVPRIIDYKTKGKLVFHPMNIRVIFFWMFIVGFGEEILFRGIIQSEFGFWTATISFGIFHALNILTILKGNILKLKHLLLALYFVVVTGVIGAVFGYLYHLTESIFAVALLHGLFDLCNHLFPPEKDLQDNKLFKAVHHN